MTKKQRLVRYKEIVETTEKLDLLSSIKKSIADYFVSALAKRLLSFKKGLKLNDIEYHGDDIFMIYSSAKTDNQFVTIKAEIAEEVER